LPPPRSKQLGDFWPRARAFSPRETLPPLPKRISRSRFVRICGKLLLLAAGFWQEEFPPEVWQPRRHLHDGQGRTLRVVSPPPNLFLPNVQDAEFPPLGECLLQAAFLPTIPAIKVRRTLFLLVRGSAFFPSAETEDFNP